MSADRLLLGDRYEVGEQIGRGGMADVHRAHDTVLSRDVAVKVLRDISAVDVKRFADEARLLSSLDHPHIVTLLDAGVDDERPWLALELVEGITLSTEMDAGALDESRATQVGREVAAALAHAHDRGVVHRDVKPSNILVAADGTAKLTDFGIARLDDASAGITLTGHTVGTAAYLSPEQVRGEPVSGAGDVYALGLMLLEALTSVRAYPGPPLEAALARLHQSPLIPTSLPPGWPGLIAAMTAQAADERPTAAEVAQRLGSGDAALEEGGPTTTVAVIPPPRRHRRRGLLVAAASLLLAGSLVLARGLAGDSPAVAEATAAPTDATSSAAPTPRRPTPSAATKTARATETSAPQQVKKTAAETGTTKKQQKTKKKDTTRGPGKGKKKAQGKKPKKDKKAKSKKKGPKKKGQKPKKSKGKK